MSVVIINHSDIRGGSSVVSRRLLSALRDVGIDVSMLVKHKGTTDPGVVRIGNAVSRMLPFAAEHLHILTACRGDRTNLFKLSLADHGMAVCRHPLVRQADTVILNWINQGMLSLEGARRLAEAGKRVIWTMHDLWNAVGICHVDGTCRRRTDPGGCRSCPLLGRGASEHDISAEVWRRKHELYAAADITFVAVSSVLAEQCRSSALMQGCRIVTIPNAIFLNRYRTVPRRTRAECGLPDGPLVVMGAARLDDPVKGLDLAVEALNKAGRGTAVFFGGLRDAHALDGIKIPHVYLGVVEDDDMLADIYAHAAVVLSSSHYESWGATLAEGQASGAFPVSFDTGGRRDIITDASAGRLVRYPDTDALADAILYGLTASVDRDALRRYAARFDAPAIARRYISLFANP